MAEKITITIEMRNSAFDDTPGAELGRILRKLAGRLESHGLPDSEITLRDANGNRCGSVTIE